ncbi:MAG: alkaline phosphatase family protein [Chloroflexota bacterium]
MANAAKKAMVLGIDAPIVPRLVKWAREGKLPTIQALLERGVHAPHTLVPFPTITPPGWTSIATGAWPGTHGITDFDNHIPGTALDLTHKAFDSREVLAEPIWVAAERAGKRSIVMNYPTSWPSHLKDGWLVGGVGTMINDWRLEVAPDQFSLSNLAPDMLLATESYPFANEVAFAPAKGWEGIEHGPKALEATVTLTPRRTLNKLEPITWHLLVDQSAGKGYDTVTVANAKNKQGIFARLQAGEWSPNIYQAFATAKGPRQAVFKMKLVELSPDAAQFRLYVPGLCALEGWAAPQELENEIKSPGGLPTARAGWESFLMEWIDAETLIQTIDFHHDWLADASEYLLMNKPWDLYFIHVHTPDWMYHTFSKDLDPLTSRSAEVAASFEKIELAMYEGVDRCLGRIMAAGADDETLIFVTSDHGAKALTAGFHVEDVLEQAGLTVYQEGGEGHAKKVDWSKTKAVGQRYVHIYVNTQGRDPEGIVAQGEEYERVRDQIVKALHEYVDPETGLKPISLALRREDARIYGLYGERVGDVVYALDPRFGKEHGNFLPTAQIGIGDMHGLFIVAGPGVKQGETLARTVHLTDVVPTMCHLMELPIPEQCEGSIIYQALEDPNAKDKELASLRRNVDRLKRMVERPPMC